MVSSVKDLTKICNGKIRDDRFKFIKGSFTNNFEETKKDISFGEVAGYDFEQFIQICDNRLAQSKIFLDDAAVVFGFALLSLSIFTNMAGEAASLSNSIVIIIIAFFGVILIFLISLMAHYRSDIHAWTVFKEIALIKEAETKAVVDAS